MDTTVGELPAGGTACRSSTGFRASQGWRGSRQTRRVFRFWLCRQARYGGRAFHLPGRKTSSLRRKPDHIVHELLHLPRLPTVWRPSPATRMAGRTAVQYMRDAMHFSLGFRVGDANANELTAYLTSLFGPDSVLPKSPTAMPEYKETVRRASATP